jgi:MraZ protein
MSLDAKGRITVPSRHRDLLQALANGQLTLTKHPEGCLMVFPRPVWDDFRQRLAALPMSASGWKRIFLGSAVDVEIDSGSRILVSPELRADAGLGKDVLLLGMGNYLELWDAPRYKAKEAAVLEQPMPEALQDFTF